MKKFLMLSKQFLIPTAVFIGIFVYLGLIFFSLPQWATLVAWVITLLGSFQLIKHTVSQVLKKQFALDYIAILAITISLITGQLLVAMILALMISSGRNLESYAVTLAKQSLTKLIARIPDKVTLWEKDHPGSESRLKDIKVNMEIFVKKGEVIPLDGRLISQAAVLDESSLTGEAEFVEKVSGDQVFSGTINMGAAIVCKVLKTEKNSTYNKIIELVKKAQSEKSPLIRLADKYNIYFTIITLLLGGVAYLLSNFDLMRVLAVLAIATPCPLIIATPVALLGGVGALAKQRIIIKRLSSLELLAKIDMLVFDKTGTITIGKPRLKNLRVTAKNFNQKEILAIAAAIERNSLHPMAKAVVTFARQKNTPILHAKDVEEVIGTGISGEVAGQKYLLAKSEQDLGMAIALSSKHQTLAVFEFEDEIKPDSRQAIKYFQDQGKQLKILTGDKKKAAESLMKHLGEGVLVRAQCKPEDKLAEIEKMKKTGKIVAMVGDGINDAPALAQADVGIVFSNEEQTAASEAADIVFLGGQFNSLPRSYNIAKQTINIARQSILGGISLSIIGMIFAAVGLIPPIFGAGLQEVIDVAVIINAIRASRINVR